ncbi:endonuclease/exonuclease/phosphatase family protein [Trinickia violacea]|uniref:Endonuclease/exonuclease/phosphatase family protein n=1 Tax=Trinickia violacea TaxID=2571746 RepID=A0A4P8IW25_9BURK|nr:endonuclease/exonuclease/phosphatase family protein [Trinickia violacea]QCP53528.1 endonuclease/exonuclease/phosphatase family protein [Trinickia violacea]
MAIKILMWNTQHLNNQNRARPMSWAYAEKIELLKRLILDEAPDIIALFEVGTTSYPNTTLVANLSGKYSLIGLLGQEGGATKNTTLGSVVFVKDERSAEFSGVSFQTVLGSGHKRATIVVKDSENNHFAFYHANASSNAWRNIKDEIDYLQDQICQIEGTLVFFGGDLNTVAKEAPDSTEDPKYHRVMEKSIPEGPGYTHVSIRNSRTSADEKHNFEGVDLGGEKERGLVVSLSMLDFAYVARGVRRRGACPAAVKGKRVWNPVSEGREEYLDSDAEQEQVYKTLEKIYLGNGVSVRSDHFPVFYELGG